MGENCVQICKSLPFIDKEKKPQGLIAQIDSHLVFKLEIQARIQEFTLGGRLG